VSSGRPRGALGRDQLRERLEHRRGRFLVVEVAEAEQLQLTGRVVVGASVCAQDLPLWLLGAFWPGYRLNRAVPPAGIELALTV
jgi:hypothetical protein